MKTIKLNITTPMIQIFWWRFSLIVLLFSGVLGNAQPISNPQQKYPGQSEIVTDYVEHYHIDVNKNNQLVISQDNHEESMIISDKGGFSAVESIVFSDLSPIKSYEAYTLNTINGRQKKTDVAHIADKKLDRQSVFDSDVKLKTFNYANLTSGSKKVLKYKIEFADPFLLHRFMFATGYVNEKRTLKISHPETVKIDYRLFNIDKNTLDISTESKKGVTTTTFKKENIPAMKGDGGSAGNMYETPHLHFWISEYKTKDQLVPVLGSVDKLYAYYHNFISKINLKESADLKAFTVDLTKNCTTNDEKMKTIFRWVQKNIKYVAFESGYEGFIPREADKVFERKFGDCKDMTSIITEMAKYVNVPNVNFTWIGTRELPYTYQQLPTPAVDNHMIATYIKDEKKIYLDATDANVPFGMPSGFIQGKEALIAQGSSYIIAKVPEVNAQLNNITDVTDISLSEQKIIGKGVYTANGLAATQCRNVIGDNARHRKEYVFSLLEKGNNKFKLSDFTEKDFDNNEQPYTITYNFELDNYVVSSGDEMYVNLTLDKPFQNDSFEPTRSQTYDHEFLSNQSYRVSLNIPKGTEITHLPENASFSNDLLAFNFSYSKKDATIELNYNVQIKQTLIAPQQFALWNESLKKLKENYLETIIIKKNDKN